MAGSCGAARVTVTRMARGEGVVIRMSARAVVASGQPFSVWGEALSDVGVALDTISDLRPHSEPLVLRVRVSGEAPPGSPTVAGDWLCEADGSPPAPLPRPDWGYSPASRRWASRRTWLGAWERCSDARWLLAAAAAMDDRGAVALAACRCARESLKFVAAGDDRPRLAIEAAEGLVMRGGPDMRDRSSEAACAAVAAASEAAYESYEGATGVPGRGPHASAAYAAYAASAYASHAHGRLESAPEAAFYAAYAFAYAEPWRGAEARARALSSMADVVRASVPTIDVLRHAAGGG